MNDGLKKLYTYRPTPITGEPNLLISLQGTINACKLQFNDATVLLYATDRCIMGKLRDNQVMELLNVDDGEQKVELNNVYEARLFNETMELRWLKELGDDGRAVLLSDIALTESPENWQAIEPPAEVTVQKNRYLLWGKYAGETNIEEWSALSSARIGSYYAPCGGVSEEKPFLLLKTKEFISSNGMEDGNSVVIDERFCSLKAVNFANNGEAE